MFNGSVFNQDISNWDVSNVLYMQAMFENSSFNQDINDWDVGSVVTMVSTFRNSDFNQPLNNWDVASVKMMSNMFEGSPFNQDISEWCTWLINSEPTNFGNSEGINPEWGIICRGFTIADNEITLTCSAANVGDSVELNGITYTKRTKDQITTENASTTCTSGITDMDGMFREKTEFNGDISHWDVSSVTTLLVCLALQKLSIVIFLLGTFLMLLTWEICSTEQKALIKTYQDGMFRMSLICM